MDELGRDVISKIVRTGEMQPYIDAGFGQSWLDDPAQGSEVVFGDRENERYDKFEDEDRVAYRTLLEHYDRHGRVPTPRVFLREVCDYDLLAAGADEIANTTTAELVELVAIADERWRYDRFDEKTRKLISRNDYAAARELAGEYSRVTLGATGNTIQAYRCDELTDEEETDSLVEDYIDVGSIIELFGEPSAGKTFVAIDWACSVATGIFWHGRVTKQRRVLYVASEGGRGFKKRLRAWERRHSIKVSGDWLTVVKKPVQVTDPAQFAELLTMNRSDEYDLIVIDTLSQSIVGLDENAVKDMGPVVANFQLLRDAWKDGPTTILFLHHPNKRGDDRGSSSIPAGIDAKFKLSGQVGKALKSPGHPLILTCSKRKEDEEPGPLEFMPQRSGTSLVFTSSEKLHDAVRRLLPPDGTFTGHHAFRDALRDRGVAVRDKDFNDQLAMWKRCGLIDYNDVGNGKPWTFTPGSRLYEDVS
jgi:archaellum biogenesis ATPase FlaH